MASRLESLSTELVEMVVTILEPRDIGSLRLTSRALEAKASQGEFTKFFAHKEISLTSESLQAMVSVTARGRLGCLIQHLTVTGLAWCVVEEEEHGTSAEECLEYTPLLVCAFGNLKSRSRMGHLSSLSLRVAPGKVNDYLGLSRSDGDLSQAAVWQAAKSTFEITAAALSESKLQIEDHLDIFGGITGCSLEHETFRARFVQNCPGSIPSLSALRKVTLSLSAPAEDSIDGEADGEEVEDENSHENFGIKPTRSTAILQDMLEFLRLLPRLESLDLHWYDFHRPKHRTPVSSISADLTNGSTDPSNLKTIRLKYCALRGISCFESDLLQFLRTANPASLVLEYIHLEPGATYERLFEYLVQPSCPIAEYQLEDICRGYTLVHYDDVPGGPKFSYSRGPVGPSTVTRQKGHSKVPIRYRFPSGRPKGSGEKMIWSRNKAARFGWPTFGRFDFIKLNAPSFVGPDSEDDGGG